METISTVVNEYYNITHEFCSMNTMQRNSGKM